MKYFPLKTATLCLVLTPFLYIATINGCNLFLKRHYLQALKNQAIGDSDPLLAGSVHIEEQVANNIQAFLKKNRHIRTFGLVMDIRVVTRQGKIIYPLYYPLSTDTAAQDSASLKTIFGKKTEAPQAIAKKNFDILNSGMDVILEIKLPHGSILANLILLLYAGISLGLFFILYRAGNRKAGQIRMKEKERHQEIVQTLEAERQKLFETIKALSRKNERYSEDKKKAKVNEEEMFQEILSLEDQLNAYIELKKEKEMEIDELKIAIEKVSKKKTPKGGKRNEADHLAKRFAALYKNLEISKKAVDGFLSLEEGQQIKAEEIIHQLDRTPDQVVVKRKVFFRQKK